jgi:hypothetical protein
MDGTDRLIATFEGPGVRVEVCDATRCYGYLDVFAVKLQVTARFAPSGLVYERTLEKMGVSDKELDAVKAQLLASWESAEWRYLQRPEFVERLQAHRSRVKTPAAGYQGVS